MEEIKLLTEEEIEALAEAEVQTTFNLDLIEELVEEGEIENVSNENN
jgi:hypothetical protein